MGSLTGDGPEGWKKIGMEIRRMTADPSRQEGMRIGDWVSGRMREAASRSFTSGVIRGDLLISQVPPGLTGTVRASLDRTVDELQFPIHQ